MKRTFEQLADAQSRKVHQSELATLRAQRDDLLAALEYCITYDGATAERSHTFACQRLHAISEEARAAIAKARGE